MKIIALIPVKNEAWILKTCLTSLKSVADEVVILDDNSTDGSRELAASFGAHVVNFDSGSEKHVDMSARRQKLLDIGRQRGGTHFIWLDADEAFSADFLPNARELIATLAPGEKLCLQWIQLWKSVNKFRDDGVYHSLFKDFVVADDPNAVFKKQSLSEGRTPGHNDKLRRIAPEQGVVLHYQQSDWRRYQFKQAWYRCSELIEGARSAKRINNTYLFTLDDGSDKISIVPEKWISGLPLLCYIEKSEWHEKAIYGFFDKYGIEFFEPLQIWHIKELHDAFVVKTGRESKSMTFHQAIIKLNEIRNILKNKLRLIIKL